MVGGPRKERRVGRATRAWNRPSETSSTITWQQGHICQGCMKDISGREHLEECADGHEVLIGKDDHAEEGGESTVKDVRSGPEGR